MILIDQMFSSHIALKLSSLALFHALLAGCLFSRGQRYEDFVTKNALALRRHFLVLGFMGGRDSWKAKNHLQGLATKFRAMRDPSLHVETVENRKRGLAIELIQKGARSRRKWPTGSRRTCFGPFDSLRPELWRCRRCEVGEAIGQAAVCRSF